MWVQVRLITLTLFVTGLIWFYADQAIKESGAIAVQLELPPLRQMEATIIEPPDQTIQVHVSGAARDLARAAEELGHLERIALNVANLKPGRRAVELLPLVQQAAIFEKYRLTLNSVSPSQATVEIDKIVSRELKLVADTPVGVEFVSEPVFDPEVVTIRYPSLQEKALPVDYVSIGISQYTDAAPGKPIEVPIPLPTTLAGVAVKVQPKTATLRMTLRKIVIEKELEDSIAVKVQLPVEMMGKYTIKFKDDIADRFVKPTLMGPPEAFATLSPRQISAYINITTDNLEASKKSEDWIQAPVQYIFPSPDISVKKGTETPREFRILPVEQMTPAL